MIMKVIKDYEYLEYESRRVKVRANHLKKEEAFKEFLKQPVNILK